MEQIKFLDGKNFADVLDIPKERARQLAKNFDGEMDDLMNPDDDREKFDAVEVLQRFTAFAKTFQEQIYAAFNAGRMVKELDHRQNAVIEDIAGAIAGAIIGIKRRRDNDEDRDAQRKAQMN